MKLRTAFGLACAWLILPAWLGCGDEGETAPKRQVRTDQPTAQPASSPAASPQIARLSPGDDHGPTAIAAVPSASAYPAAVPKPTSFSTTSAAATHSGPTFPGLAPPRAAPTGTSQATSSPTITSTPPATTGANVSRPGAAYSTVPPPSQSATSTPSFTAFPPTGSAPPVAASPYATPSPTLPGAAVLRPPVAAVNPRIASQTVSPAATVAPAEAAQPASPPAHATKEPADVFVPDAKEVAEAERRNGPIFVDWPKPVFSLMITGDLTGYIEPCGCAGLENLKGGLSRRHSLLKKLTADGWPVAPLDLGGQVRRVGTQQTEIKLQATVKGLIAMGYGAVGFGADDLRLPAATLLGAGLDPYLDRTLPFTSADVVLFAPDSGATAPYRVVQVGGKRVGVTSILGEKFKQTIQNDGIVFTPAEEALAAVTAKLKAERCDLLVLLCYADPLETEEIAKKFPQYNYVVTTGGADEPPGKYRLIEGTRTAILEVGRKGQHAIVLGFYDDPADPVRYQRVPLDARFPESREMKQLLVEYQDQLRVAGFVNLGITEKIHPRTDPNNPAAAKFVGSEQCRACHESAFDVWKKSGHSHATERLVALSPPRHFDPECISCHVTGWDPQQYVPFRGGFLGLDKTPLLAGSGCENCHGPGGAHVAAEGGGDAALQKLYRGAMHVSVDVVERTTCLKCHDHDNSPEFSFETYWPKVAH